MYKHRIHFYAFQCTAHWPTVFDFKWLLLVEHFVFMLRPMHCTLLFTIVRINSCLFFLTWKKNEGKYNTFYASSILVIRFSSICCRNGGEAVYEYWSEQANESFQNISNLKCSSFILFRFHFLVIQLNQQLW